MKLYCKGEYHNPPAGLHYAEPGVIEVDNAKAEFLLRDAPDNFSRELPPSTPPAKPAVSAQDDKRAGKSLDAPTADKQVKEPTKKK